MMEGLLAPMHSLVSLLVARRKRLRAEDIVSWSGKESVTCICQGKRNVGSERLLHRMPAFSSQSDSERTILSIALFFWLWTVAGEGKK